MQSWSVKDPLAVNYASGGASLSLSDRSEEVAGGDLLAVLRAQIDLIDPKRRLGVVHHVLQRELRRPLHLHDLLKALLNMLRCVLLLHFSFASVGSASLFVDLKLLLQVLPFFCLLSKELRSPHSIILLVRAEQVVVVGLVEHVLVEDVGRVGCGLVQVDLVLVVEIVLEVVIVRRQRRLRVVLAPKHLLHLRSLLLLEWLSDLNVEVVNHIESLFFSNEVLDFDDVCVERNDVLRVILV